MVSTIGDSETSRVVAFNATSPVSLRAKNFPMILAVIVRIGKYISYEYFQRDQAPMWTKVLHLSTGTPASLSPLTAT